MSKSDQKELIWICVIHRHRQCFREKKKCVRGSRLTLRGKHITWCDSSPCKALRWIWTSLFEAHTTFDIRGFSTSKFCNANELPTNPRTRKYRHHDWRYQCQRRRRMCIILEFRTRIAHPPSPTSLSTRTPRSRSAYPRLSEIYIEEEVTQSQHTRAGERGLQSLRTEPWLIKWGL